MKEADTLSQENNLELAIDAIRNGEVVGIPTETVYGIGVDPYSQTAVDKIFSLIKKIKEDSQLEYILEMIKHKVKIINDPTSIRNISEKIYSNKYHKYLPNTIFSQNIREIRNFFKLNYKVILKPVNGFGGNYIYLMN